MTYNNMDKEELILELQKKDKEIEKLKQKLGIENEQQKTQSPVSFEIINFSEDGSWIYIELLWKNNTSKNIYFIEGTLKFFDSNDKLVCVDNKHICSRLSAYSEKAEVVEYLKADTRIPDSATNVEVSISNIHYL